MIHNYGTWKKTVPDDISIGNGGFIYLSQLSWVITKKKDQWQSKEMPGSLDRLTPKNCL